ncbi:MAG: MBL fold metallo-hydrolase [Bradymonadaceae bacterium]
MRLRFFAHAAVAVGARGDWLIVDPYESGSFDGRIAYAPIPLAADYVLSTHDHADHAAFDALPGDPAVVEDGAAGPFEIQRFAFDHDEFDGRVRGGSVDAVRITDGETVVVHLSDVGQSPEGPLPDALVPVGGHYTAGAAQGREWARRLAPRTVVPVHHDAPGCGLPLQSVDPFLAHFRSVDRRDDSRVDLAGVDAPADVTVLLPECARV